MGSRNRIKSNDNSKCLPREIIDEILTRVPAESLVRFKIVCKFWKTIISDPKFIKCHLLIWESKPAVLVSEDLTSHRLLLSDIEQRDSTDFPICIPDDYTHIVASTDGLLLFRDYVLPIYKNVGGVLHAQKEQKLCVHNPVTGIQKKLPPNPNLGFDGGIFLIVHDASIQKYKVMVFKDRARLLPNEINLITIDHQSSGWRKLISPSTFCLEGVFKPIAVNGILYWLAYNCDVVPRRLRGMDIAYNIESVYSPRVAFVQSMDIGTEEFGQKICLPCQPKRGSEHQLINCNLLVMKGSIYFSNPATEMELVLWMLEDLGNHIWVKKHKICLLSIVGKPNSLSSFLMDDSFHPIQMVGNQGLMIIRHDWDDGYMGSRFGRSWYLYNLRSQELKAIVGTPIAKSHSVYSGLVITHVKSLVGWN
ncbi:F-box protein At3g17710-like [Cornus florida]|uniref:F-box protein At3g17710-like n=1 Tax=Cornus florida TaxID=4283 RepID=UPI002897A1D8|nr:F-box protein At3g17710-like [Cornus florida]XP_059647069.1 F-box protein At3g17710-like [Cornus florida]